MLNEKTRQAEELLNNINGFSLDINQRNAIYSNEDNTLIIAGAGTGKTLTLVGKIRYLIEIENIKEEEILCISFTNDSTNSLKNKIKENYNYNVEVLTFHKLAIKILKDNNFNYQIIDDNYLNYIIEEFFYGYILNNEILTKEIFNLLNIRSHSKNYLKVLEKNKNKFNDLKKLIETFINLYKGRFVTNIKFKEFFYINKNNNYYIRKNNYSFLIIAYSIYNIYEAELYSQRKIDFNDMINLATNTVKQNGVKNNYKYILIDEYQDTSFIRYELIKSIKEVLNSKLVCVGDDFQSIYRFAGCDLDIFVNFEKYYGSVNVIKLEKTYRNCQELLNIAEKFITSNPIQIKKVLISSKSIGKPIVIIYSKNFKEIFKKLILNIHNETNKPILIIGRNNFDIDYYIDNTFNLEKNGKLIYSLNPDIKMRYLTAHKSKGLEEENVILINCIDDTYGFPNKLRNENILDFVVNTKDSFKYEEERRLFYVSITRTKNRVYIITDKRKKSIFLKELIWMNRKSIEIIKNNNTLFKST